MSDYPGIYIHIPFCVRKCPYCDFFSITDLSWRAAFLGAVKQEIQLRSRKSLTTDSLYFGGGTPSLLEPGDIEEILRAVQTNFTVLPDSEITLEVNPGTVNRDYLNAIHALGINRLNIGVQSFRNDKLRFLGRIHRAEETQKTVDAAMGAGFSNLGLDLIYGLPGESRSQWLRELTDVLRFQPTHLSCYLLTYEPGTPMDTARSKGEFTALDPDITSGLFRATSGYLEKRGFFHYEISNFSVGTGFRSRHNSKYWKRIPYLGFGPSAHSFDGKKRFWNHSDVKTYVSIIKTGMTPVMDKEILTREQEMAEWVMLGLRTSDGIDIKAFDGVSDKPFLTMFQSIVNTMETQSWARLKCGRLFLTLAGRTRLDTIIDQFAENIFMDR